MHVLLIHQAFAGPDDPGGTRHFELAQLLASRGHRITVIASEANYLTGTTSSAATSETPGIEVLRVPLGRSLHTSYLHRALAFAQFSLGAAQRAWRVDGVDVVWGTSPPLTQLLPAWIASLRAPGGLVFEERDLWPEFAVGMGVVRDGLLAKGALGFKRMMYALASRVVINSPGFRPFLDRYGVDPAKIDVVANGVDATQFRPDDDGATTRAAHGWSDRFVVLYAGAMGPANDLGVLLDAAEQLRDTRALFVLVGDGKVKPQLVAAAAARGLDNVQFLEARPKREMPAVLAATDACVATLRDIPLFTTTYPNKVFDYMAAGRPVLLGIGGVIRQVVDGAGAGVSFPPGDAPALANAVRSLVNDPERGREMGRRGRAEVCRTFDRRVHADQIERVFQAAIASRSNARALWDGDVVKRLVDVAVAAALLTVLAPVMAVVALAIVMLDGTPVLFRQQRPGRGGRTFSFLKFRTMRAGSGAESDAERLTPLGRLLRATSLDELPQLWNVLRGDMSLVGPRPLLPQYLDRYTPEQARRHEVPPGITGLAQIGGRNTLSWERKFELDIEYVDHRSMRLDLWILWRTFIAVVRGEGVSATGHATMPEFTGTKPSDARASRQRSTA